MSKKVIHSETWWQSAMAKAIAKINLNTILLAIIAAAGGVTQYFMAQKQTEGITKQDKVAAVDSTWKKRSEMWRIKIDSSLQIGIRKNDSILLILKNR